MEAASVSDHELVRLVNIRYSISNGKAPGLCGFGHTCMFNTKSVVGLYVVRQRSDFITVQLALGSVAEWGRRLEAITGPIAMSLTNGFGACCF